MLKGNFFFKISVKFFFFNEGYFNFRDYLEKVVSICYCIFKIIIKVGNEFGFDFSYFVSLVNIMFY